MSEEVVPRKLTDEEIEHILSFIPMPDALTRKHAEFIRLQLVQSLREQIKEIDLTPDGIDDFINHIVGQFESSRIKTGSMVGLWATESHGNKIQQDSLNTVHKAGAADSRGAGGAVERLKELLLKQPSKISTDTDSCTIIFKDIQTRQSIKLQRKPEIVYINVAMLLSSSNPYIIEYQSVLFPDEVLPSWYEPFCSIFSIPLPDTSNKDRKLLRLFLDIEHMMELKVLMSDVRKALLAYNSKVLNFYVSPLYMGVVDIWAIEEELHTLGNGIMGRDVEIDIFNILYGFAEKLNTLRVKGIPGIRDVDPQMTNIWQLLTKDQPNKHVRDNVYEYRIYPLSESMLEWDRVEAMFKFFNIDIIDHDPWKSVTLDGGGNNRPPPHKIITQAMDEDRKIDTEFQKEAIASGRRIVTRPMSPDRPSYWVELWYGRTIGTNLRELIMREDVNPRLMISNKPSEVLEVFGIFAARRVLLEEIYKAYQGGREEPAFNARHMSIIADFTTHTGIILPNNSLASQDRSTLSKATFARHFDTLMGTAMGVSENLADVSSAIMTGVRLRIGPRAFEYENTINRGITAEEIKRAMQAGSKSSEEIDRLMQTITAEGEDEPLFGEDIEGGEELDDEENDIIDDDAMEAIARGATGRGLAGKRVTFMEEEIEAAGVVIQDDDIGEIPVVAEEVLPPPDAPQVSTALKETMKKLKKPFTQAISDNREDVKRMKQQRHCASGVAPHQSSATARKFTEDLDDIEDLSD